MTIDFNKVRSFVYSRLDEVEGVMWDTINYYEICEENYDEDEDEEGHGYYTLREVADAMGANYACNGATKVVFFFDELPEVVVKIPFIGDDEGFEFEIDYCAREAQVSEALDEAGCGDMVCRTYFLGNYHDRPIYVSERATEDFHSGSLSHHYHSCKEDVHQLVQNLRWDYSCVRSGVTDVWENMLDCFGKERVMELINVFEEWEVNDCHYGNIAYKNEKPVFIDYSGYFE